MLPYRRLTLLFVTGLVLALFAMPAMAQDQAQEARASAYGLNASLAGSALLEQLPSAQAQIPPGTSDADDDTLLEVPLNPLIESATADVSAAVEAGGGLEAVLQERIESINPDVAGTHNATGYAITEDLDTLEGTLEAQVIEGEAVAACVDGETQFATGANLIGLQLGESELLADLLEGIELPPLLDLSPEPNTVVVDLDPVIKVTFWETNWDGDTGTTDGDDTVWVNALRIQAVVAGGDLDLLEGDLLDGVEVQEEDEATVDIIVSHAEAEATVCDDADDMIEKEASSDVVQPGETFTYTIDVNAPAGCDFENVTVTDTITGPAGFQIVDTSPEGEVTNGTDGEATIVWNGGITIPEGEAETFTVDVRVPDDASAGDLFAEDAHAEGVCDGRDVDGDLEFEGPRVGDGKMVTDAEPAPKELPVTGGGLFLGGLAALGLGLGLRRLATG